MPLGQKNAGNVTNIQEDLHSSNKKRHADFAWRFVTLY